MIHIMRTIALLLLSFAFSHVSGDRRSDATQIILKKLNDPENYDKNIIPPTYNNPLDVYVTLLIRNVDLDDIHMKMSTDLTFRMQWRDERLRFHIRDVPDVTLVDYKKLWLPDPFFKNSQGSVLQKTIHPEAFVRIEKDGTVLFSSRFVVTSNCPMMLHRFPHDKHDCEIQLGSYGYRKSDVSFSINETSVRMIKDPVFSQRFTLDKFRHQNCHAETTTGEYSCIKAIFTLNRVFNTYLLEWYVPCMFFVIVGFFSELVSIECLVPRLLLTLGPMLTLAAGSTSYKSGLASVPYPTAMDVFSGISLSVIFATLLNVIISYYRATKQRSEEPEAEPKSAEEEISKDKEETTKETKFNKVKKFLKERSQLVTRVALIGFYCVFVFLYFAAYTI